MILGRKRIRYKRFIPLYIMVLPGLIYVIINNYIPLGGLMIAFKQYNYSKGFWGSPSVGLKNFESARPYYMQFTMKADAQTFFKVTAEEIEKPIDPMELIYPKELPLFDKYDEFLPEALVKKGFACGVLDLEGQSVTGFREKAKEDGGWINGGFMVMEPEIFTYLSEEESCVLERAPLETLAREGKLGIYKHPGFWQCMDTQRDRMLLEEYWESGGAPWRVW